MAMRPPVPVPTLSRRAKLVIGAIAVLLVLFTAIGTLTNVYVDYLWFDETGYTEVFWTELQTRVLLFAVAGVATGGLVARGDPPRLPVPADVPADVAGAAEPRALPPVAGAAPRRWCSPRSRVVLGLFAGFTAQGSWQTWLSFRNSTDFGQTDPQFGMDLSFFVFDYPFYRLALGFAFAIVLLALIGSLLTHYVFGGLRLQTPGQKLTAAARVQLSVLLGIFVALKAVAYWLDRYGLVYSDRGERVHRRQLHRRQRAARAQDDPRVRRGGLRDRLLRQHLRPQLPAAGRRAGAAAVSSLVIGVAYPAIVQQFVVKPSADQKEAPYIKRAIASTPAGLRPLRHRLRQLRAGQPPATRSTPRPRCATLRNDTQTIPNARLLDPNVLADTFTARQQIRNVYGFPEKLDIDRYTIDGKTRDYVVAARELNSAGLSDNQDNWINRHTVYTHGNGFVAAPANEVVAGQEGGEPNFTTGDLPTSGQHHGQAAADLLRRADQRQRLLGRRRAPGGSTPREFDQPEGGSDEGQINNTYDGEGGVVGRQLLPPADLRHLLPGAELPALRRGQRRLAGDVRPRPPATGWRRPRRSSQVDGDPYPAVIDGRITWILDGYTTSDNYPYSERRCSWARPRPTR